MTRSVAASVTISGIMTIDIHNTICIRLLIAYMVHNMPMLLTLDINIKIFGKSY